MTYRFRLEKFEGPLDLLLHLIEEQKMDISTVSLAGVTEQFLRYLTQTRDLPADELADFLVVAAKLLLIKSRILLPNAVVEEEDGIDLEKQLKMYKLYYDAAMRIEKMAKAGNFTYARGSTLRVAFAERKFRPPERVDEGALATTFRAVLKRLEPFVTIPEATIVRTVHLRDKLEAIRQRIESEVRLNFQTLLAESKSRTEIIVTFLALLELVKQRTIIIVQDSMFSGIEIQKREPQTVPQLENTYGKAH